MNQDVVVEFLEKLALKSDPTWWEAAALDAAIQKRDRHIIGRHNQSMYLSRFWLSPPAEAEDGELESGRSTLLHYFHRGDDDDAMHDHPWDFCTTILSGGYTEQLPQPGWDNVFCYPNPTPGPELLSEYSHKRRVGDKVFKRAKDLHMAMG
jgi:hypothetical protein